MGRAMEELGQRMEQVTEHLLRDNSSRSYGRVEKTTLLLIIFIFVIAAFPPVVLSIDTTKTLENSGIRYPEGFDVNTVGEVKGKVQNLIRPEKGPVIFDLLTASETYKVIAAPSWFIDDLKIRVVEGDEIKIVGSKAVGKDSNLYIVARDIYTAGSSKPVSIRDSSGEAQWRSPSGSTGSRGGYGGSGGYGGRGGPGGASGGDRGGRR
jgi:hypothetical protein